MSLDGAPRHARGADVVCVGAGLKANRRAATLGFRSVRHSGVALQESVMTIQERLERAFDLRGTPDSTRRTYAGAIDRFERFFGRPGHRAGSGACRAASKVDGRSSVLGMDARFEPLSSVMQMEGKFGVSSRENGGTEGNPRSAHCRMHGATWPWHASDVSRLPQSNVSRTVRSRKSRGAIVVCREGWLIGLGRGVSVGHPETSKQAAEACSPGLPVPAR
jgi:hypothetical protein